MGHVLVLICFVALGLRDSIAEPLLGAGLSDRAPWKVLASVVVAQALLLGAFGAVAARARTLLARGELRGLRRAERAASATRASAVLVHAAGVLLVGSLDAARLLFGDLLALDELLVVSIPLATFLGVWWVEHPIQRRVREALLLRRLDAGETLPDLATRVSYVWTMARTQLLFVLVPVTALLAWSDAAEWAERWARGAPGMTAAELTRRPQWVRTFAEQGLLSPMLMIAGVATVFSVFPLALRLIWPTTPLGAGTLRDAIDAAQRAAGVRPGPVLVWRTGYAIANGAVVGFIPTMRYVLLSDLLLSTLRLDELQAVAAHEAGHLKHRHAVWLVLALLAGSGLAAGALWRAAEALGFAPSAGGGSALAVGAGAIGVALLAVGAVSRRFEWQADSVAARALARVRDPGATAVLADDARAMGDALRRVAAINGVALQRRGWRHGSIATRLAQLDSIVGRPISRLPIDLQCRTIKLAIVAALALAGILAALDMVSR